ncbi:MAG: peptidoglycan editing factor PgeF [Candidatus Tectomicrobia bacterium]|uniref:Purine nucleoside phosphorylase n=1 Tax=Tectimicrobiota bacterium TaxID=2528274 RepID=A0A932M136_UNCTE|nr:peptidoglycan editing factor PgeF [Candidatus Tectomicrobia bacterium]
MIHFLRMPNWDLIPNLIYGFLERNGGVSARPFDTLNLSYRVGDDPASVKSNWHRVKNRLGLDGLPIVTLKQVHGDHIVTLSNPASKDAGEGDALVTRTPHTILGILTADCVPILLVDPSTRVVAAVHAGWRGTLLGITEKAVQHLKAHFAVHTENLQAALGPAIGGCCYEIESHIFERIQARWGPDSEPAWSSHGERGNLDLRTLITHQLYGAGLKETQVFRVGPCTSCSPDFFSYRRERKETGRQLSFIGWLS